MANSYLKTKLSFEFRKTIHYVAWLWGIALIFHAPNDRIFWLIGGPLFIQFLDWCIGIFSRIHKFNTAYFKRNSASCITVQFKRPKHFDSRNEISFCYVMLPWLSKYQWHAFSLFPCTSLNNDSKDDDRNCYDCLSMCIIVSGKLFY